MNINRLPPFDPVNDPRGLAARQLADHVIHALRDYIPQALQQEARNELYRCAYQVGARLTTDGLATAKEIDDVLGKGHQAAARGALAAPDPGGHGGYSAIAIKARIRDYEDRLIFGQRVAIINAQHAAIQAAIAGRVGVPATALFQSPSPALPQEVKAGEIVGWRAWRVNQDGAYASMFMSTVWKTGEVIKGDVKKVSGGTALGVHAWKTQEQALAYVRKDFAHSDCAIVIGTVELWGTVIEHQEGYRASFGQMKEVVASVLLPDLELQQQVQLYGVQAAPILQAQQRARRRYPDYDAMEKLAVAAAHRNPHIRNQILTAVDQAEEAYRVGKVIAASRGKPIAPIIVGIDPAAYDDTIFTRTAKMWGRYRWGR